MRLVAEVIAAVGVVGLALSVLGLFAMIAYSITQRTREIGIRTLALSTVLSELLNGVDPRDPAVYITGTAVLLSVKLLANVSAGAAGVTSGSASGAAIRVSVHLVLAQGHAICGPD